ncbi:hypothetical protein OGAPHI_002515 [Ogataea philodendri]|uniref:Uncharacterized protein n=1 Tax=Ogataea philodendri TaxID=1378263 RepID=A0A9P8PBP8_9ASCO|nr:uncharacterized protein OGAPHI_002515 [Ogataea philodendri]KAH3668760.1 hypothetical protein OGAPHI_002515 [Ogataea philodendri]
MTAPKTFGYCSGYFMDSCTGMISPIPSNAKMATPTNRDHLSWLKRATGEGPVSIRSNEAYWLSPCGSPRPKAELSSTSDEVDEGGDAWIITGLPRVAVPGLARSSITDELEESVLLCAKADNGAVDPSGDAAKRAIEALLLASLLDPRESDPFLLRIGTAPEYLLGGDSPMMTI